MSKFQTRMLFGLVFMLFVYEFTFWQSQRANKSELKGDDKGTSGSSSNHQEGFRSDVDNKMLKLQEHLETMVKENKKLINKIENMEQNSKGDDDSDSDSDSGGKRKKNGDGSDDKFVSGVATPVQHSALVQQLKSQVESLENEIRELKGSVTEHAVESTHPFGFWSKFGADDHWKNCQKDFGFPLLDHWRANPAEYCRPTGGASASSITCNRIKQNKHTAHDNFCYGKNIGFDASKMNPGRKMGLSPGAISGQCEKTGEWTGDKFQLDLGPIMQSFAASSAPMTCVKTIDTPTLFVSRDGFLNVFHSMADFVNAFQALTILKLDPADVHVVVFDGDQDGPYFDLWNAFGGKGVTKGKEFLEQNRAAGGTVCYKNAIFGIPAGSAFMWKDIWFPNECRMGDLMRAYTRLVLRHFDLLNHEMPGEKARITLGSRKPFAAKGGELGRVILNEDRLFSILTANPKVQANKVDFAALSYRDQLKTIRNTDIYVFMHGAGGTHLVFLPDEAVVVELFPATWHQSSMRNLAKWTGKIYLGWQNTHMDKHGGPSLATTVDEAEFKTIMNEALHVWSAFHRGKGLWNEVPKFV